jgi:hypothetical protein
LKTLSRKLKLTNEHLPTMDGEEEARDQTPIVLVETPNPQDTVSITSLGTRKASAFPLTGADDLVIPIKRTEHKNQLLCYRDQLMNDIVAMRPKANHQDATSTDTSRQKYLFTL